MIGPLADEPWEQLGTWVFDGDPQFAGGDVPDKGYTETGTEEVRCVDPNNKG